MNIEIFGDIISYSLMCNTSHGVAEPGKVFLPSEWTGLIALCWISSVLDSVKTVQMQTWLLYFIFIRMSSFYANHKA